MDVPMIFTNTIWDPFVFSQRTLANGLTMHHSQWNRPWLVLKFLVHVGARDDPKESQGINHFVEHGVFNNVPGHPVIKIERYHESLGKAGEFGEMRYLGTWYKCMIPLDREVLRHTLYVFGLALLYAKFEHLIEQERGRIVKEFGDQDPRILYIKERDVESYRSLFHNDHRMAYYSDEAGTPESVLDITQQQLQNFYDASYTPANIEVISIGGLSVEEMADALSRSPLGRDKPGKRNPIWPAVDEVSVLRQKCFRTSLSRDQRVVEEGQFPDTCFASKGLLPGTVNPSAVAIFMNGLKDRLFQDLSRDLGATYGFDVHIDPLQDYYLIRMLGTVDNGLSERIEDMVREHIEETGKDEGIFSHFRTGAMNALSLYDLSAGDLADLTCDQLRVSGTINPLSLEAELIRRVTMDDMKLIAGYLAPERRSTYILEP